MIKNDDTDSLNLLDDDDIEASDNELRGVAYTGLSLFVILLLLLAGLVALLLG